MYCEICGDPDDTGKRICSSCMVEYWGDSCIVCGTPTLNDDLVCDACAEEEKDD